jgi:hypothetical protein
VFFFFFFGLPCELGLLGFVVVVFCCFCGQKHFWVCIYLRFYFIFPHQENMSHLQDLAKVAHGLALVVRESIRMGSTMGTRESTAAAQMLKSLAGTVTDLTGLTKGTIHNYYRDGEEAQLQQHQRQQKSIQEEEAGGPIGGFVHCTETSSASSSKSYLHRQLDSLSVMRNQEEPLVAADDEAVGNITTETVSTSDAATVGKTPLSKPVGSFTPVRNDMDVPISMTSQTSPLPSRNLDPRQEPPSSRDGGASESSQLQRTPSAGRLGLGVRVNMHVCVC